MDKKGNASAHLRRRRDGSTAEHSLEEHLQGTALRAAAFAECFGSADWAYCAGLWHDLGKYNPAWQEYLRSACETQEEEDE